MKKARERTETTIRGVKLQKAKTAKQKMKPRN